MFARLKKYFISNHLGLRIIKLTATFIIFANEWVFQSLKKEVDWDRNDDKAGESSSDYRLHESVSTASDIGVKCCRRYVNHNI